MSSEQKAQSNVENHQSSILADCIRSFHIIVVLFVLAAPFFNIPYFLILHISFSISLLVHWYSNSNVCSLSMLESRLRGLDYTDSFTHKFIAPIYDVSQTTWSQFCYIITITLMCISIYNLYYSEKMKLAIACYHRKTSQNESLYKTIIKCGHILLS